MSQVARRAPRRSLGITLALITALAAAAPIAFAQGGPVAASAPVPHHRVRDALRRPVVRADLPGGLSQGLVDGETARVYDYQADHPALVRVEEPLIEAVIALFAVNPSVAVVRLQDLPATPWRGVYVRGVAVCAKSLAPWHRRHAALAPRLAQVFKQSVQRRRGQRNGWPWT